MQSQIVKMMSRYGIIDGVAYKHIQDDFILQISFFFNLTMIKTIDAMALLTQTQKYFSLSISSSPRHDEETETRVQVLLLREWRG